MHQRLLLHHVHCNPCHWMALGGIDRALWQRRRLWPCLCHPSLREDCGHQATQTCRRQRPTSIIPPNCTDHVPCHRITMRKCLPQRRSAPSQSPLPTAWHKGLCRQGTRGTIAREQDSKTRHKRKTGGFHPSHKRHHPRVFVATSPCRTVAVVILVVFGTPRLTTAVDIDRQAQLERPPCGPPCRVHQRRRYLRLACVVCRVPMLEEASGVVVRPRR